MTPAPDFARYHRSLAGNFFSRWAFAPAAALWSGAMGARRFLYRRGILPTRRLTAPVVGVGNLAVGGSGKTPFAIFLGQYLINHGVDVAYVSRGYGRIERGQVVVRRAGENIKVGESAAGDEALMAARALPQASVVVDADRAAAGTRAVREFGAQVVILDDAFQYLRLRKDLNILLVDARRPPGPTLPAGYYREGLGAVADADFVIFTRCRPDDHRAKWRRAIARVAGDVPAVEARFAPAFLRPINRPERVGLNALEGAKVLAFAGIADFDSFADDLVELGAVVARRRPFADHHRFTHAELADAEGTALVAGCDYLVTTAKDEARLETWRPAVLTYVLEQSVEIIAGDDVLNDFLDRVISSVALRSKVRVPG